MNIQDIVLNVLNYGANFIGIVGVIIILFGSFKALYFLLTKKTFWEVRVVLVKHILLGLDFLIARDVIETVLLTSDKEIWTDLIALIIIIGIRIVFSFFAEKEMSELMDDKSKAKIKISKKKTITKKTKK